MVDDSQLEPVRAYFENTLKTHGASARGVDWNSDEARALRFEQLVKVLPRDEPFSLLDYGCGYGAFAGYVLEQGFAMDLYVGYDILEPMVAAARDLQKDIPNALFTSRLEEIPQVDYASACGVFNMKLQAEEPAWTEFTLKSLSEMNALSRKGFSVNFLTKYSDPERMRPDLYYADPCLIFDYCKTHFSKNVALLHDYNLYDFTVLVRK